MSLTLTASATSVNGGQTVTLTATASSAIPSGYFIDIFEVGTQTDEASCTQGTVCTAQVSFCGGTHSFVAYVDDDFVVENPPKGTIATSNTVSVTWNVGSSYTLSLSTSAPQAALWEPVTLTATASGALPSGCHMDVYDQNVHTWWQCTTTSPNTCQANPYYSTDGPRTFIAYLDGDNSAPLDFPPTGILATSNTATVTWANPSSTCYAPTLPVLSGNVEVLSYLFAVQVGSGQTRVCARVTESATTAAVGGLLIIPTQTSALPTTDSNASACWTTPGNTVPGRHPIATTMIGSTAVTVDSYAAPGVAWACLLAGNVGIRVIVPTTVSLPSVQFYSDPDSLVQ